MSNSPLATRILLCACPAHCAQVLRAAAQARMRLQDLQTATQWPAFSSASTQHVAAQTAPHYQLLWALLPPTSPETARQREAAWRHRFIHSAPGALPQTSVQMLYGNATQQAQQLVPWIHQGHSTATHATTADCVECLDGDSEQQLFQRLIRS